MKIINHYPANIEPVVLRINQLLKQYQNEVLEQKKEIKGTNCLKSSTSFPGEQFGKMPD